MMPTQERISYGFRVAFVQFAGFAVGVLLGLGIEKMFNPLAFSDDGKFSTGELMTIIAIFILITGLIHAFGAWFGAVIFPIVPSSKVFWLASFSLGLVNALAMLAIPHVSEINLYSTYGIGGLAFGGLVSALCLRPMGLTFQLARPWFAPGLCQSCGYDLRRTPAGGSCPECGAGLRG